MPSTPHPGYVAARLYYPIQAPPGEPEALTRAKADRLVARTGQDLEVTVETTPFGSTILETPSRLHLTETRLHLVDTEWSDAVNPQVPGMDGTLTLRLRATDVGFLQRIIDHRDPDWSLPEAFRRRILHWGTQNWGGMTWTLSDRGTALYCCAVDAFLPEEPEELTDELLLQILSFDPESRREDSGDTEDSELSEDSEGSGDVGDAGRAKDVDADPPSKRVVGRCRFCGGRLELDAVFLALLDEQGGIVIVPCACGRSSRVRVAGRQRRERDGFDFEVL